MYDTVVRGYESHLTSNNCICPPPPTFAPRKSNISILLFEEYGLALLPTKLAEPSFQGFKQTEEQHTSIAARLNVKQQKVSNFQVRTSMQTTKCVLWDWQTSGDVYSSLSSRVIYEHVEPADVLAVKKRTLSPALTLFCTSQKNLGPRCSYKCSLL